MIAPTRRAFLSIASVAPLAAAARSAPAQTPAPQVFTNGGGPTHPLLDIHIHQMPDSRRGQGQGNRGGGGRTEAQFLAHQKAVNAVGGVLLGGNDYEYDFVKQAPDRYIRFASGMGQGDERAASVERALKNGAKGIGEHRWEGDIPFSWRILDMARDYKVPVLFHFEQAAFPRAVYSEFYKVLEKYPTVTFIGHGIDWWGAIDKNYNATQDGRPRGLVTPGGLTDQWLSRYPNLYSDMSAGSGNNALMRDPYFASEFVNRHQDRLMFGSDCTCTTGGMPTCWSAIKIVALNYLGLSPEIQQKIYLSNAQRLFDLKTA
jgi:predicted TIM-barrel fold metal-dependent hydrolase